MTRGSNRKKAVFIGNDINNVVPGYSWSDLLDDLIEFVNAGKPVKRMSAHFPLFYEQIWAHAQDFRQRGKGRSLDELDIKTFIAERIKAMQPNGLHEALVQMDCHEYLTTNYDFCLERALGVEPEKLRNEAVVGERRYSRFRRYRIGDSRFWHLHGDAQHPASIALGYEHYSGYLQNLRNYVIDGVNFKNRKFDALLRRLKRKEPLEIFSWLDVFFTHDIHMLGFGLDFSEIHLWWLLTFLSRGQRQDRKSFPYRQDIHYYLPSFLAEASAEKIHLLRSLGFRVVKIDADPKDMSAYYRNAIRRINRA